MTTKRIAAAASAIGAALLLAGCSPTGTRAGVGLPPAMLFKWTTTPMAAKRPERGASGLAVPTGLNRSEVTAHQIALNIPGVSPPGTGQAASVGWGNVSTAEALRAAQGDEVIFADAEELSILGIYTRLKVITYATPASAPEPTP